MKDIKLIARPKTVHAFLLTQETRASNANWPAWMNIAWNKDISDIGSLSPYRLHAREGPLKLCTFWGYAVVNYNDWIVCHEDGSLTTCTTDVLDKTYDVVG